MNLFFWLVKRILTKSAEVHNEGLALVSRLYAILTYNCTSWSRKGVETESEPPWKYSSGQKRKKNVIQDRYVIYFCLVDPPCTVSLRQCNIVMGVGRTRMGGGYCLT